MTKEERTKWQRNIVLPYRLGGLLSVILLIKRTVSKRLHCYRIMLNYGFTSFPGQNPKRENRWYVEGTNTSITRLAARVARVVSGSVEKNKLDISGQKEYRNVYDKWCGMPRARKLEMLWNVLKVLSQWRQRRGKWFEQQPWVVRSELDLEDCYWSRDVSINEEEIFISVDEVWFCKYVAEAIWSVHVCHVARVLEDGVFNLIVGSR